MSLFRQFLCTNLLFTSKAAMAAAAAASGSDGAGKAANMHKSKSIQSLRGASPSTTNTGTSTTTSTTSTTTTASAATLAAIQPTICNILYLMYESEAQWPDTFVRAYMDDSMGERAWVDAPACKAFVDNIRTAFDTRPIASSLENNNSSSSNSTATPITPSVAPLAVAVAIKVEQQQTTTDEEASTGDATTDMMMTTITTSEKVKTENGQAATAPSKLISRYAAVREQIEAMCVDVIRSHLSTSSSSSSQTNATIAALTSVGVNKLSGAAQSRPIGSSSMAASGGASSPSSLMNACDTRNFIKLVQSMCGIGEIRALAMSKLDAWLINPKVSK